MKDLHPIDWSETGYYISDRALVLTGCDSAVLGITDEGLLCYSYELLIDAFVSSEDMTPEEAREWVEFNVLRLQGNGGYFQVVYTDI
tara:strand:+ start:241 stop:501 length:261 start_codon:yes stop_codon:yes gene_type:complete